MGIIFGRQWLGDSTWLSTIPYGYLFSLAQGMPVTGQNLWWPKAHVLFLLRMRPRVLAQAPGIPRALFSRAGRCITRARESRRGKARVCLSDAVIASVSEAIQ